MAQAIVLDPDNATNLGANDQDGEIRSTALVPQVSSVNQDLPAPNLIRVSHNSRRTPDNSENNLGGQYDSFFFEEVNKGLEEGQSPQSLTKIDAIRISLCLSVKALYQMTKRKKRPACQPIIEN